MPIFLNVDRDIVKPGLSFTGWGGFDIGWVVFDFGLGLQWTGIDTNKIPNVVQPSGLRAAHTLVLLAGRAIPSAQRRGSAAVHHRRIRCEPLELRIPRAGCGWYYCRDDSRAQFAPGFSGKAGLGIHLKNAMYLDVGFQYSMSGKGDFFNSTQWWVEPFVGFIYRGDSDRFGGTGY